MKLLLAGLLLFLVSCNQGSEGNGTATDSTISTSTGDDDSYSDDSRSDRGDDDWNNGSDDTVDSGNSGNSDNPSQPTDDPSDNVTDSSWTGQFMKLVNDHRTSIGLKALTHDAGLGDIATEHSENMANGSVAFGHTGFSSRCVEGRAVLGGGNWCGENVAMGQKTPQAAFTAWMNSPGHRANIEQSRATHTGFGYAQNSSGTYYWTQIFLEN